MWISVAFILILCAVLVAIMMQRRQGGGAEGLSPQKAAQYAQGVLTVTGVSERPPEGDKNGQVYCTISGTILGDQTAPTEVYGSVVLGIADPWPQVGADIPVIYKPGKTDSSWRLGTLPQQPDPGLGGPPPNG